MNQSAPPGLFFVWFGGIMGEYYAEEDPQEKSNDEDATLGLMKEFVYGVLDNINEIE